MKHRTKQKLIRNYVARYKGRRVKRPEGMGVAEFIKTYFAPKMLPVQKRLIEMMAGGKELIIWRPNGRDVMAQLVGECVVVKPYKPKKQKVLVTYDEYGSVPENWVAEKFSVDYAQGKDKSVTVFVKKEEGASHDGSTDKD